MSKRYLTAESVCAGHPDKLCDIIADSILEACLRKDKASRVACEVMATKGKIIVAGEISCSEKIDIRYIVRNVLKEIGYNCICQLKTVPYSNRKLVHFITINCLDLTTPLSLLFYKNRHSYL
jgi:S-adenosylmethionine synthetase